MNWPIIREKYPDRWVLVEAIKANSKNRKRHIDEMAVLFDYSETKDAWNAYKKHHLAEPDRVVGHQLLRRALILWPRSIMWR